VGKDEEDSSEADLMVVSKEREAIRTARKEVMFTRKERS
jgi:hypothetical protein